MSYVYICICFVGLKYIWEVWIFVWFLMLVIWLLWEIVMDRGDFDGKDYVGVENMNGIMFVEVWVSVWVGSDECFVFKR